jgi:hypothetical protein
MTVEVFTPASTYTVSGVGPYAIGHPYLTSAIVVYVTVNGQEMALSSGDVTVTPGSATVSGSLFLSPAAATTHAGRVLRIERDTAVEQGWVGVQGEREKGLETQLDRLTYGIQELDAIAARTLRVRDPIAAFVPVAGRQLLFDGTAIVPGSSLAEVNSVPVYAAAAAASSAAAIAAVGGAGFYITPEQYGAVANGVADDRAAFIAAEAAAAAGNQWPILLTGSYYLSSNTGNAQAIYELAASATVTMGTGSFQPARLTDNTSVTYSQKVNFTATNPVSTGEPSGYSLLGTSYIDSQYLINQWGRQNMVDQASGNRTGAYGQYFRTSHAGEGDGYGTFWSTFVTAHPRIASATQLGGQNSGGLGGGQTNAGSNQVNLYGHGDVVVHDQGYQSVALYNYVGITYFNGTDGAYSVPRLGCFQLSKGTNPIDANFLAGGPTKIAFDATKADVTWGAFAMKSGQKILFDATEAAPGAGKFAATAPGSYYMMNSPVTDAIVVGRGVDDADVFRIEGSSTTARLSMGAAGTVSFITAHSSGADNTTLTLRTALAGVEQDQLIIGPSGSLVLTAAGISAANMHTHANNAAAISAGRAVGTLYKTASGEVRIVV